MLKASKRKRLCDGYAILPVTCLRQGRSGTCPTRNRAEAPRRAKTSGYATCAAHRQKMARLKAAAPVTNRSAGSSQDWRSRDAPSAAATATVNNAPHRIESACKLGL